MSQIVMVRSFEVRKTKNQDSYGSLRVVQGREGNFQELDAKIWGLDNRPKGSALPAAGDLIEAHYQADDYQGRPQWIIKDFRVLDADERRRMLASFVPPDRIDRAFYRKRLDDLIERIPMERPCGQIVREIYDNAAFREAFYVAPAARDHHQNYPGGLLEHTVNVTSVALCMADVYGRPDSKGLTFNQACLPIDREVLIAAGLLHDIGKVQTYRLEPLPELTEANFWEGHLVLSYVTVRRLVEPMLETASPAERDEMLKLLHCILAHHGQLEYGSPVAPACAEAFLLAQADMTDARLAEIASAGFEALGRDPQSRWLKQQFHFRGGIFVGDWPRQEA